MCTAVVLAARRSRDRPGWAVAAGAATVLAVVLRPVDAVIIIPVAFCLDVDRRVYLRYFLGGLPRGIPYLLYNQATYGAPLSTGYAGVSHDLALSLFGERFNHYTGWLLKTLSPVPLLGWLAAVALKEVSRRDRLVLLSWFGSFFLFYCFYRPHETWWYLRFLIPAAPALTIGTALALAYLHKQLGPRLGVIVASTLAVLTVTLAVGQSRCLNPLDVSPGESVYPVAAEYVIDNLPQKSIVLSMQMSGALRLYTEFIPARWDWMSAADLEKLCRETEPLGYRWHALLFPFEVEELMTRLPVDWRIKGTVRNLRLYKLPTEFVRDREARRAARKRVREFNLKRDASPSGQ